MSELSCAGAPPSPGAPDDVAFLAALVAAVGAAHVLTDAAEMAAFLRDWRGRFHGQALAVVRPGSTPEVAAVLRLCHGHRVAVVPQGGNTGLSGGATPAGARRQIVLQLGRLNRVRSLDLANGTVTVESGCVLQQVQQLAEAHDRLFPLSLAAEGSCTVGGNLATNAGGTAVLRYGNARELCLGVEAVMADGTVFQGLRALRKDNTGYSLRDLLIGSEGTLGVLTAAVLKLYPRPRARATALVALQGVADAVALLGQAQAALGPLLTGFELMSGACLQAVARHRPALAQPWAVEPPLAVLVEQSAFDDQAAADDRLQALLASALDSGLIQEAVLAQSQAQAQRLWAMREGISEALQHEGVQAKHDIALPISALADFLAEAQAALDGLEAPLRLMLFGHVGDGNLHFNVVWPSRGAQADAALHEAVNTRVHDRVAAWGGSISAEHGLGQLRRDENRRLKDPAELGLQRALKQALDPLGLLNPGKVL
ncbi:FAD-binding oxidoreductase [Ideonella livida]|uniref:FAD-binding oxidoreductase n=1 Tax=Ideonella livida TaxID=2707176 RepID=A0A7C9TJB9_9BURK|nr:FAD-binding oxidoreductase [Ideonella livida]NDY90944.1 FAD-binding oxidoreductase [Ideonella livida]